MGVLRGVPHAVDIDRRTTRGATAVRQGISISLNPNT
jgi:hypothetical protein